VSKTVDIHLLYELSTQLASGTNGGSALNTSAVNLRVGYLF
jgi:hypothetical protein